MVGRLRGGGAGEGWLVERGYVRGHVINERGGDERGIERGMRGIDRGLCHSPMSISTDSFSSTLSTGGTTGWGSGGSCSGCVLWVGEPGWLPLPPPLL